MGKWIKYYKKRYVEALKSGIIKKIFSNVKEEAKSRLYDELYTQFLFEEAVIPILEEFGFEDWELRRNFPSYLGYAKKYFYKWFKHKKGTLLIERDIIKRIMILRYFDEEKSKKALSVALIRKIPTEKINAIVPYRYVLIIPCFFEHSFAKYEKEIYEIEALDKELKVKDLIDSYLLRAISKDLQIKKDTTIALFKSLQKDFNIKTYAEANTYAHFEERLKIKDSYKTEITKQLKSSKFVNVLYDLSLGFRSIKHNFVSNTIFYKIYKYKSVFEKSLISKAISYEIHKYKLVYSHNFVSVSYDIKKGKATYEHKMLNISYDIIKK